MSAREDPIVSDRLPLAMPVQGAARLGRLLVISYHFPPDGSIGGLRWHGLSKFLARFGWEIHVVTAARGGDDLAIPGVIRHECMARRTLNDIYRQMRTTQRGLPGGDSTDTRATDTRAVDSSSRARNRVLQATAEKMRQVARIALGFPDSGRGWVLRAGMTGRALLEKQRFDAVVTSGPPHSAHFAGVYATLGRRVPHIVDMRDPWRGGNQDFPAYGMDPVWLHRLLAPLEHILFQRVNRVIANTREFAESLHRSEPRLRVSHIPNGTDTELLPCRTSERWPGISIAHVGTLYAGRSLGTVTAAFARLASERPADAARFRLRLAGNIGDVELRQLRADLASMGLDQALDYRGSLPRAEALDLLRRSHLALVLAQGQPTQVPGKLYECLGLGIPTLALTEPDSATAREAVRLGALVLGNTDVAGMHDLLENLLDGRVPETVTPRAPVSYQFLAEDVNRLLCADIAASAGAGTRGGSVTRGYAIIGSDV